MAFSSCRRHFSSSLVVASHCLNLLERWTTRPHLLCSWFIHRRLTRFVNPGRVSLDQRRKFALRSQQFLRWLNKSFKPTSNFKDFSQLNLSRPMKAELSSDLKLSITLIWPNSLRTCFKFLNYQLYMPNTRFLQSIIPVCSRKKEFYYLVRELFWPLRFRFYVFVQWGRFKHTTRMTFPGSIKGRTNALSASSSHIFRAGQTISLSHSC